MDEASAEMGSSRNNGRKSNLQHNRRSRGQRLRRIREKCEKERLMRAQSGISEPLDSQTMKLLVKGKRGRSRKSVDEETNELHTYSEIVVIPNSSEEAVCASKGANYLPPAIKSAKLVCRPSPLSTPLLDSTISSYINFQNRYQQETMDAQPEAAAAAAAAIDVPRNPTTASGKAMAEFSHVIDQARELKAHCRTCKFGGKLVFDSIVGEGITMAQRYICNKIQCGETKVFRMVK